MVVIRYIDDDEKNRNSIKIACPLSHRSFALNTKIVCNGVRNQTRREILLNKRSAFRRSPILRQFAF